MPKTKPNPWNLTGPLFVGMILSVWLLTLGIFRALNAPDWAISFVLIPSWVLTIPAAAWGSVRVTERVYTAQAPVFDWQAVRREANMAADGLCEVTAGLIVLAVALAVPAGMVAVIAILPVSLAVLIGALIIATALRR